MFSRIQSTLRARSFGLFGLMMLSSLLVWMAAPASATHPELAGGRVHGHVFAADTGAPVAGAIVQASGLTIEPALQTRTNDAGEYVFENLPAARWAIGASAPGLLPSHFEIELLAGQTIELNHVLQPEFAMTGEISGRVTNADNGQPVRDAFVFIFHPFLDSLDPWIFDRTDENGYYVLAHVPAMTHGVHVRHAHFESALKEVTVHSAQISTCNFALHPTPIEPPGAIAGRVVDAVTREPIAGASISVDGIATFAPVYTDENGDYSFDGVPPGVRNVHAFAHEHHPGWLEVIVVSGEVTVADFELRPSLPPEPVTVTGHVFDGFEFIDQPIAGAHVCLQPIDPDRLATFEADAPLIQTCGETNEQGAYRVDGVPPGVYSFHAQAEGYFPVWRHVVLEAGDVREIDFELYPVSPDQTGKIAGAVTNQATGEPVPGAWVFFAPVDAAGVIEIGDALDATHPHVRTGEDGFYETPPLLAGTYWLLVRARGFEPHRTTADVAPNTITRVDVALTPADPADPGAIAGRIFNRATNEPIGGATIFFAPIFSDTLAPDGTLPGVDLTILPHVVSNDDGSYAIRNLGPGFYSLIVEAPGFHGAGSAATVESGKVTIVNIGLAPIVIQEPGGIFGLVTDALTGGPIANAVIFFGPLFTPDMPPEWWLTGDLLFLPHVRTGDDGRYSIENLSPGEFHLLVQAVEYEQAHRAVGVEPGRMTEANFALKPFIPPLPGAIIGTVSDAQTGVGIGGATVFFQRLPEPLPLYDTLTSDPETSVLPPGNFPEPPSTQTNADGIFGMDGLPPGAYRVTASAPLYLPGSQIVEVHSEQVTEANFELVHQSDEPGSIFGRVVDATTQAPLAGADVWVVPDGDVVILGGVAPAIVFGQAVTDDNGDYRIDDIPVGPVRVFAAEQGFETGRRQAFVFPLEATEVNFELRPDVTSLLGHLVGTVRSAETEEPIAGALVTLIAPDPVALSIFRDPTDSALFRFTDDNGQYAFRNLPPGGFVVAVVKRGFESARREVAIRHGEITVADFRLKPTGETRLGSLHGRVTDVETGAPIAGAWVRAVSSGTEFLSDSFAVGTQTDANGEYEFPRLRVGPHEIHVAARGFESQSAHVEIVDEQRSELDFALARIDGFGAIEGTVIDAFTGEPIEGARVFVPRFNIPFASTPRNSIHTRTDANGHYRLEEVPAGERVVVAFAPLHFPDAQIAIVEPGQTTAVDFALIGWAAGSRPDLRVETVDAATGAPLPGVGVHMVFNEWVEPFSEWDLYAAQSDSAGVAVFADPPPGEHAVVGVADGYLPATTSVSDLDDGLASPDGSVKVVVLLLSSEGTAFGEPRGTNMASLDLAATAESSGWLATSFAGATATAKSGTGALAGLCISSPVEGDNIGVWESPRSQAIALVQNSVYRIRFRMSTDQSEGSAQPVWNILVDNLDEAGRIIWGSERWFFANTANANAIGNTGFDGLTEFDAWIVPNAVATDAWNGVVDPDNSPFAEANQDAAAFNIKFRVLDVDPIPGAVTEDSGTLCLQGVQVDRFDLSELVTDGGPLWGSAGAVPSEVVALTAAFSGSTEVASGALVDDDDGAGTITIELDEPPVLDGAMGMARAFVQFEDASQAEGSNLRLFPIPWNDGELLRLTSEIRSAGSAAANPVDVIGMGWQAATNEIGGFDFSFRGQPGGIMDRAASPRDDSVALSTYTSFFYSHHSSDVDASLLADADGIRGVLDFFNRTDLAGALGEGNRSDAFEIRSMAIHRMVLNPAIFGEAPAE